MKNITEIQFINLSQNERAVLAHLNKRSDKWTSPTELGQKVDGKKYTSASSWGSRVCKKLVAKGLVTRNDNGLYQITESMDLSKKSCPSGLAGDCVKDTYNALQPIYDKYVGMKKTHMRPDRIIALMQKALDCIND